ncbi:MAG: protein translocase subunit SecD [Rickettsiales bacterium]|nr:protein translocase subunit SecD [Rickettsiales bacterium]
MLYIERWKIWFIAIICLYGFVYASPNILGEQNTKQYLSFMPSWGPSETVNLGLDLQGGSHLLLQVEMGSVLKERLDSVLDEVRRSLRKERIGYVRLKHSADSVTFSLRDNADIDKAEDVLNDIEGEFVFEISDSGEAELSFSEDQKREFKQQVISQSIEIVRRRIDETGTREPIIQAQGTDRILVQLPGIDNPERVKDLLGKTAKLSFNLVNQEASPNSASVPAGSRILPFSADENQKIVVERRSLITGEMLVDSQPTFQDGQPVVSFRFDSTGSRRFCEVTKANIERPFAIVLDGKVISAPNIKSAICGGSGIISGGFTTQEANDLSLLLRAGALPAPLTVLEERTVGPSLGADSVEAGKIASLVAIVAVLVFMTICYGLFGIFANIALIVNISLIFALLSSLQATLTLPGIAGIVLTVGMAVDANVLIFERIREEFQNGRSMISSIDSGYKNALSTIVDANITTLIAAIFLYAVGTGPVKGFAVTLAIGIITSMFSAIMLTRLIVVFWHNQFKPTKMPG